MSYHLKEGVRNEKWAVIINPKAGKKRLRRDWVEMYRMLKRAEIEFQVWTTQYAGHAIEIARYLVERGFRNLLIVGGDGTINEVVNGVYTSKIDDKDSVSLALIPYGTGNDWARYWGLYKSKRKMSDRFFERNRVKVDLVSLTYYVDDEERKRYFINGMGVGFDAQVCSLTDRLKRLYGGHSWVYSLSLVIALFKWKPSHMQLIYDDDSIEEDVFTIAVGNGCFSGGGIKQVPADPTDGLLHVNVVPRLTFKILSTIIGNLIRGELWKHPACTMKTTKRFKIKNRQSLLVETDGILIDGHGPYTVEILPSALNMMV